MPSFDITSEFNQQEVINAIDQMNREIINRYDFKDTKIKLGSPKYAFIPIGAYDPEWFLSLIHI